MQESDLKHFDRAMIRLCAGFNVPLTDPRRDAYWRAFRRLEVLEFAGLIDTALVEASYATLPTVGELRALHDRLQPKAAHTADRSQYQPTIAEQLVEHFASRIGTYPCTFVYRMGGECIGLVVECGEGEKIGFSVEKMQLERSSVAA